MGGGIRRRSGRWRGRGARGRRAVRTGEVVTEEEIDYLREDGGRGTVSVNAAPVRDRDGVVVAGVAIFTDVSERKTLEQEKQAFLNAITHDLRSPLTTIKGIANLLQREVGRGTVPKQRLIERLQLIDDATLRMSGQLTELQDIARLRTGQALELQRRLVDLVALVQDGAARHQAASKRHEISVVQTGMNVPELLGEWDESRLDRVLDNLLGNALKFSPGGGKVTLSLAGEPGEGDAGGTPPGAVAVL